MGGDDVYMMRNIRRLTNWRMCFNREAIVNSKPVPLKILSVIHQKIRHAAKGVNYTGPAFLLGILVYLCHWGILAGILQWFFTDSVSILWIYFCCARFVVDFLLLKRMSAIDKFVVFLFYPSWNFYIFRMSVFFPVAARLGLYVEKVRLEKSLEP